VKNFGWYEATFMPEQPPCLRSKPAAIGSHLRGKGSLSSNTVGEWKKAKGKEPRVEKLGTGKEEGKKFSLLKVLFQKSL